VDSKSLVDGLEAQIREIIQQLQALAITPHVRELRAKAVTYSRVIGSWGLYPPSQPQFNAMTECVAELLKKVDEATRDMMRESGRMPSGRKAGRASSNAPPKSAAARGVDPFEAALRGDPSDATGVRTRGMRPPPRGSTAPPPEKAATVAPPSRKRPASDTRPTPIPALLHTRRSR
jgi:hypothetical protein